MADDRMRETSHAGHFARMRQGRALGKALAALEHAAKLVRLEVTLTEDYDDLAEAVNELQRMEREQLFTRTTDMASARAERMQRTPWPGDKEGA